MEAIPLRSLAESFKRAIDKSLARGRENDHPDFDVFVTLTAQQDRVRRVREGTRALHGQDDLFDAISRQEVESHAREITRGEGRVGIGGGQSIIARK